MSFGAAVPRLFVAKTKKAPAGSGWDLVFVYHNFGQKNTAKLGYLAGWCLFHRFIASQARGWPHAANLAKRGHLR